MKYVSASGVDELKSEIGTLLLQKRNNTEKLNEKNARLSATIKRLQSKKIRNKKKYSDANFEIDRQVKKISKLIMLESEHAKKVAEEEKKDARAR